MLFTQVCAVSLSLVSRQPPVRPERYSASGLRDEIEKLLSCFRVGLKRAVPSGHTFAIRCVRATGMKQP